MNNIITDRLSPRRQPNLALVSVIAAVGSIIAGCSTDAKEPASPNFSPSIIIEDRARHPAIDLKGASVGDCKRDPNSWATDSGGSWNANGLPVESTHVVGLAKEFTAEGLPILEDGFVIERSLGALTITPLFGDDKMLFKDPSVLDEPFVFITEAGNTVSVSPYDDYRAGLPFGINNNRTDDPLVVTITCGQQI